MDIQYILDEYSCAIYIAEYVNKSNRGFSALHRELIKLKDEYPDADFDTLMKELGKKTLNNVEMTTQEAAWFLLRLPMSRTSRFVTYIPTQHPSERFKSVKTKKQMNEENLHDDSTNIWNEDVIQKYEQRPPDMELVNLAEFVAWYTKRKSKDKILGLDNNLLVGKPRDEYYKRDVCRIIRWRNYDSTDGINYMRELVLLFHPFRSEELDLLSNDKYICIFESKKNIILEQLKLYDVGIDFEKMVRQSEECEEACPDDRNTCDTRIISDVNDDNVYTKSPRGDIMKKK